MAVSKMDIVNVIGGLSALNAASEVCGKSGVFHSDNPMLFYAKNQILAPLHEENPYQEPVSYTHLSPPSSRKRLTVSASGSVTPIL